MSTLPTSAANVDVAHPSVDITVLQPVVSIPGRGKSPLTPEGPRLYDTFASFSPEAYNDLKVLAGIFREIEVRALTLRASWRGCFLSEQLMCAYSLSERGTTVTAASMPEQLAFGQMFPNHPYTPTAALQVPLDAVPPTMLLVGTPAYGAKLALQVRAFSTGTPAATAVGNYEVKALWVLRCSRPRCTIPATVRSATLPDNVDSNSPALLFSYTELWGSIGGSDGKIALNAAFPGAYGQALTLKKFFRELEIVHLELRFFAQGAALTNVCVANVAITDGSKTIDATNIDEQLSFRQLTVSGPGQVTSSFTPDLQAAGCSMIINGTPAYGEKCQLAVLLETAADLDDSALQCRAVITVRAARAV